MRPDLRDVLKLKLLVTLVAWALPCLLLPREWFRFFGLDLGTVEALVLCRLLGAAYVALCVGYGFCLFDPERYAGMRVVGIVSNGAASAVLWLLVANGMLDPLPLVGEIYLIASAVVTAGLAAALVVARAPSHPQPEGLAKALARPVPAEPVGTTEEGNG